MQLKLRVKAKQIKQINFDNNFYIKLKINSEWLGLTWQPDILMWKVYEAMFVYLRVVHELYQSGRDFRNGTLIRLTAANRVFEGACYCVIFSREFLLLGNGK